MLTLIGSPKTRGFRVLWALEELGLQYDVINTGPHSDAMKSANPSGKVPALKDGDDTIIDSTAILQYLTDKHGKLTAPAGTMERAQQDSLTFFALDEFDSVLWTYAKHDFVLPEDLRLAQIRPACEWELARSMKVLERRLGDNKYVMGDDFTVPDIIITHCAGWMERTGFAWPDGAVSDYVNRVRQRPAFQKAWEIRSAD